jgi:hypothetical protein
VCLMVDKLNKRCEYIARALYILGVTRTGPLDAVHMGGRHTGAALRSFIASIQEQFSRK